MNIKDILPYYIPCRVQVDGKEWGQLIGFSKHDEIEQYLWDIVVDGEQDSLTWGMPYNDDFSDDCRVKPVLRPLDSMTEEERNERAGLVRTIPGDKLWIVEGKATNPAGIFEFGARIDGVNAHWLLSRGFDLFGLIESGAAIDSNTLTQ